MGSGFQNLITCDIFILNRIIIDKSTDFIADDNSFVSLVCIDGEGTVSLNGEEITVRKGECLFIPASAGKYTLSGDMSLLETKIP